MRVSDYPFSKEAASHVRQAGFSLESLLEKTSFKTVRNRAAERVSGSITGQIYDRRANTEAEHLTELLSYPLARVMVSCIGDQFLFRRYSLAEAKLAFKRLESEKSSVIQIAEDLGIHPQGPEPWKLHFAEYIRAAHRMHSPKWKLVNRDLKEGFLSVTDNELKRLLEEAVRDKVQTGLPLSVDDVICKKLTEYLDPLRAELETIKYRQRVDLGKVEMDAFPPCIRQIISHLSEGVNLAHTARFAIVSFLLQINMPLEEVISLFNNSPDFNEDKTRYQIAHIAGASGTKYKPPACATMATYGNCPGEDSLCRRIKHPLSYYERQVVSLNVEKKKLKENSLTQERPPS